MYEASPSEKFIQQNFKQTVQLAKRIFNKNKFRTIFTRLGRLTLVEFHDAKNSMTYNIKFIFDKKDSTLYVSGDLGSAVFSWYSSRNSFWTLTDFAKNTGYFIEKRQTESNMYVYNSELAKLQIRETFAEINDLDINTLDQESEEKLKDFFDYYFEDTDEPLDIATVQQLHREIYDEDWIDDEPDYGRLLGPRPIYWLTALTEIKNHPITFVPNK